MRLISTPILWSLICVGRDEARKLGCPALVLLVFLGSTIRAAEIFVEAESFADRGGWELDTQFIAQMGSPYLIAHGLGEPVSDAKTKISISEPGVYRVWVRTLDWVARWKAKPSPGRFQVCVDGKPIDETFGTKSADWDWQNGGTIELGVGDHQLTLRDLTGFDGRCDCVYLTTDLEATPPPVDDVLSKWRRGQLGLPENPVMKGGYDLVVIGGGYSGVAAAISAARMGCSVALIQDRAVLGGNGSSEVRVWAKGNIRRGKFPRIGEIVEEFCDRATKSPGRAEEFGDDRKLALVRAEPNIDLMLNHFAYGVEAADLEAVSGDYKRRIEAVHLLNTVTGEDLRVAGDQYVDATGHGWIGSWAGADAEITPKGRMGMSNMWRWDEAESPADFPATPWALDLDMGDFPYPRNHHGEWFWESGFDKDPLDGAEAIRDWNLRAVYGAFNAMKNRDGASDHRNAVLTWVAYIGGPRESLRLLGDVVLTQDDIVEKRQFPDGFVPSTWSIDLHYPKKRYAEKFPDNPFISYAVHDRRVSRTYGYPVPYRCFYSRNVKNLFMAGRCVSVTHEALGTVRVMKTCGMMGEVVGKAASLCQIHRCDPRGIFDDHLDPLIDLVRLPGVARRATLDSEVVISANAMELAGASGPASGMPPLALPGIVVDDRNAELTGPWKEATNLRHYVGTGYLYGPSSEDLSARYVARAPEAGRYRITLYSQPHENRATQVPVQIEIDGVVVERTTVNQRTVSDTKRIHVGVVEVTAGQSIAVTVCGRDAGGTVHADAVGFERLAD